MGLKAGGEMGFAHNIENLYQKHFLKGGSGLT